MWTIRKVGIVKYEKVCVYVPVTTRSREEKGDEKVLELCE